MAAVPSHLHTAIALLQQGRLAEAQSAFATLLAQEPDNFDALHLSGVLALETGDAARAAPLITRAVALQPGFAPAHASLGAALQALARRDEASAAFGRALSLDPSNPVALNGSAILLREAGRAGEALTALDRLLALEPLDPLAWFNRGLVLQDLQRPADALAAFRQVLALKSDFPQALASAALILCEQDQLEESFALFRRHGEIVHGTEARPTAPPHRVHHDREQRAHLDASGIRNAFHIAPGERVPGPAINPANATDVTQRWQSARPQIVVIDNVLTDAALEGLRRFCAASTVWRKSYEGGYVGAIPEHGFACPLLAQLAEEFRATFPAIFETLPLRYLWGFKYDSDLKGVNIHADFAAVNVNFWITPDEANLDPESGGLVIWDVAAPLDWDFTRYNNDEPAIRDFLAASGAKSVTVPYRANRAVIFDSDLFHETDTIRFKPGYLNRRLNITMLYGRRRNDDGQERKT